MSLLPLPVLETDLPRTWSISVLTAFTKLDGIYRTASSYIDSGSIEAHRLRQYGMAIIQDAYPLLVLMEESADSECIPLTWINNVAEQFSELLNMVDEKWKIANGESTKGISVPVLVSEVKIRNTRGQPRKEIDIEMLQNAFQNGRRIPQTVLARILGIHRNTLRTRLAEQGISTEYSDISDTELDVLVKQYRDENPVGGRGYVTGWLRSKHNLRIQRRRVISAMIRIDRLGQGMRHARSQKIQRKPYSVPRPNALWHIDGHHKLIHWGIVIHGVVDGYSRKVTGLQANTSNSAATVLEMFTKAISEHGVPSRVRGDRGGENRDVAILMILLRGMNRASFMWGPSVFNTRIERMWVEIGERFVRAWRAFFTRLESQHLLQRNDGHHRWLLHNLFVDTINDDCRRFSLEWNAHPISSAGGHSPNDLAFMGQLKHGIYDNDFPGLSEPEIYAKHGFDPDNEDNISSDEEEPSEHEDDNHSHSTTFLEDGDESLTFDPAIVIDSNIRHQPIAVPSGQCPLNEPAFALFEQGMQLLIDSGDVPIGYGASVEELGDNGFDEQQDIHIGISNRSYAIELPAVIWAPRMHLWAQGLHVLNTILSINSSTT